MKAKKLLIPAMAVLLSLGITACGPSKQEETGNSSSPESKTESESKSSSSEDKNKPGSGNASVSGDYKYKIATDDPKNLSIEILNKDSIRCNVKEPHRKSELSSIAREDDLFKEYTAKYPKMDISFSYDNYSEDWEYELSNGVYASLFVVKTDDDFEPTRHDIQQGIYVKTDEQGNVKTPVISDKDYSVIQSYIDEHGPGEYELRVYVRDPNGKITEYHRHSAIPFTVTEGE